MICDDVYICILIQSAGPFATRSTGRPSCPAHASSGGEAAERQLTRTAPLISLIAQQSTMRSSMQRRFLTHGLCGPPRSDAGWLAGPALKTSPTDRGEAVWLAFQKDTHQSARRNQKNDVAWGKIWRSKQTRPWASFLSGASVAGKCTKPTNVRTCPDSCSGQHVRLAGISINITNMKI